MGDKSNYKHYENISIKPPLPPCGGLSSVLAKTGRG